MNRFALVAIACIALLGACNRSDPSGAKAGSDLPPGPLSAIPTATSERSPDCTTLAVTRGESEHAAGSEYVRLKFTNDSDTSCFIRGYPALTLKNADNRQVGDSSRPYVSGGAKDLDLAPGETVTADIRFPNPDNFPAGTCATGATKLEILIPGATSRIFLDDTHAACPGWSVSALHRGSS